MNYPHYQFNFWPLTMRGFDMISKRPTKFMHNIKTGYEIFHDKRKKQHGLLRDI